MCLGELPGLLPYMCEPRRKFLAGGFNLARPASDPLGTFEREKLMEEMHSFILFLSPLYPPTFECTKINKSLLPPENENCNFFPCQTGKANYNKIQ